MSLLSSSTPLAAALVAARGVMTTATINRSILNAQYAVRGELVIRAGELQKELSKPNNNLPFDRIVFCNIGNPQELGQTPISFHRQVLAMCDDPSMAYTDKISAQYPEDVSARARRYLDNIPGGTGAYSHSQGLPIVRQEVADFISQRDGVSSNPDHIFLTDGASPAVQNCLRMLIQDKTDGIMIPLPQYPLYSASISLFGGAQIGYYLDEDNEWGLDVAELDRSYTEAKSKGLNPKAVCVINPGNPTGQTLSRENIEQIVDFCASRDLVMLADEVYQENIYSDRPFVSFKQVRAGMGAKYANSELFSFHSVSKGFLGECGRRGGYMEAEGIHPDVLAQFYKLQSVSLCPNVNGQLMVGLKVNPPKEGDPSHPTYAKEVNAILSSLKRRATKLNAALNSMEGVSCHAPTGAMYAFPKITLPEGAIRAAEKAGKAPDAYYCLEALAHTGIVIVPGSGFGQRDGTFHFRTTFLPREEYIDIVIDKLSEFHAQFLARHQ